METKQSIRKRIFQLRGQVTDAQVHRNSLAILDRLTDTAAYKDARQVFAYMDFNHEVETRDLILRCFADGKEVAVPRVRGREMDFYRLTDFTQLAPGYFGIPEPVRGEIVTWEDALVIVPGVAFDPHCHRVGYGQGFYDRYLSRHCEHPTAAVAFSFQILEEAPWESTDVLPDMVVTENQIYKR